MCTHQCVLGDSSQMTKSDGASLNLSGVIKTALANMDREMKSEYQVLLQAKDMGGQLGGLASTTTINITLSDVNDNPPRFAKSKAVLDWFIEEIERLKGVIWLFDVTSCVSITLRIAQNLNNAMKNCLGNTNIS